MRFLFFVSFSIVIILTGCQSVKPPHLVPVSDQKSSEISLSTVNCQLPAVNCPLPTPFSSPTFEKALFKASLDIREHHLTGLVFVKKIPDTGYRVPDTGYRIPDVYTDTIESEMKYRVIFSNEFGMTYFDLEIESNRFQVNYCFEFMNKKALWKILEIDLRLLFATEKASDEAEIFIQDGTNYLVCRNKQGNLERWDIFSSGGDTLVEIRGRSNLADQVFITLTNYQKGFPSRIIIFNSFIRMRFSLSLLSIN